MSAFFWGADPSDFTFAECLAERDALRAKLADIRALTWDPKARGLGETLPRDITPSANRLLRQILGDE